jgi:dCTP deaminase
MGTLSDSQIRRLVESGKLIVRPFEESLVQPASYDLRLGAKVLASPLSADILGATVELSEKSPSYRVQSGQMIAVISAEWLELPLDMCGRFGIRSEFARRGLNAFGGLQLDPGFKGRLTMTLVNVGPEPITLTVSNPLFSVEFHSLDEPAESGYEGIYQGQKDFPADQYDFILSARTTSLAEIPTLRQELALLSGLVEELRERFPDPDDGLEVRPEVQERLRQSLRAPRSSLLSIDDVYKKLGD